MSIYPFRKTKLSLSHCWWKAESKTIEGLVHIGQSSSGSVWGASTDGLGFAGRLALEKRKIIFNLWQRPGFWANRSPLQSPEYSLFHSNGIYFSMRQGHVAECLVRNALAWSLLEWNQNRSVCVEEPRKGLWWSRHPGGVSRVDQAVPDQAEKAAYGCREIPADQQLLDNGHRAVDEQGRRVCSYCVLNVLLFCLSFIKDLFACTFSHSPPEG